MRTSAAPSFEVSSIGAQVREIASTKKALAGPMDDGRGSLFRPPRSLVHLELPRMGSPYRPPRYRFSGRITTRLCTAGQRRAKAHPGSLTQVALCLDAAAVGLGYRLDDGQPQPRPPLFRRAHAAVVALEDAREFLRGDARALVGAFDQQLSPVCRRREGYLPSRRSVLRRVLDQNEHGPLDEVRRAPHAALAAQHGP